ncbi:MAG: YggT family protein [Firmicutes bacterium]|nr:YggT family protein [Bacillota bacterium]
MEEKIKKTKRTYSKKDNHKVQRITGIIFIIIEVILGFRFILKLAGANFGNVFVKGIYYVSQLFVGAFEGIFSDATTKGLETTAVFEPATLIAMVVIGVIAWIVLMIIKSNNNSKSEKQEIIEEVDDNKNL